MKKAVNCIIIAVGVMLSCIIYNVMTSDENTAIEIGSMYSGASLSQIQSKSVQSSFNEGLASNTGGGSSINANTSEWYTDMSDLKKGSCRVVETCQGFDLYDSPTFDAEGITFFFNSYKASCDLLDMIEGLGIKPKRDKAYNLDWWMNRESGSILNATFKPNATSNKAGTLCKMKDDKAMLLFAPMPTQCSDTYYSSGAWHQFSSYWSDEILNIYFNIVLVKQGQDPNNQSNWMYLPATPADVKAHTYPWGVAQTNLRVNQHNPTQIDGAGASGDATYRYNGDRSSTDFIRNTLKTQETYGNYASTIMLWDTCEATGVSTTEWNQKYDMVGCITYNGVRR